MRVSVLVQRDTKWRYKMLLRYPGGKSRGPLSKRIVEIIKDNYSGGTFAEPFFGGGGITFYLLKEGVVDRLLINDFDLHLTHLWNLVIHEPRYLRKKVKAFNPSVHNFLKFKQMLLDDVSPHLGFEYLVVNRTSHAGRGVKAGPQGGLKQQGKYKIDCRWNPDKLVAHIDEAHELLTSVKLSGNQCYCDSYYVFLERSDFYYFDPPYWDIGEEMYNISFTERDHIYLYERLKTRRNWVLSYNNHKRVLDLYKSFDIEVTDTSGNGGHKKESEVIICNLT